MRISIAGMHCQACVDRVRRAVEKAGGRAERVEVGSALVVSDAANENAILESLRKAGYEAHRAE